MNILDQIIAHKRDENFVRSTMVPVEDLMESKYFDRKCFSLTERLIAKDATGIIAEFKRKSPSRGYINRHAEISGITQAYTQHGASGLSVLTDREFFGGSTDDLALARKNEVPILRKDFIIDPYQVVGAKAMGADVILLIAACLTVSKTEELAQLSKQLGMEVLLELHEESELEHICAEIDMVGINNRSLKTFKVDINRSLALSKKIPDGKIKIAESGISQPETIRIFRDAGYQGFLIGENFMKENDPGKAFEQFVKKIK